MSPGRSRDPRKEQFWRDHLHCWQHSGLTVRAYCRRQHLAAPSFYGWRRILAERDRVVAPVPAQPAVTFVPLRIQAEPDLAAHAPLELVLGNGRRLRIPAGFAPESLRAVVALLEDPSC